MPRTLHAVAVVGTLLALGVAGCGGGSSSSSSGSGSTTGTNASGAPGRAGIASDPKAAACLKAAGITVPSGGGFGGRRTGTNGAPPTGTNGAPPTGTNGARPGGGFRGGNPAQFQKMQAALKKCGITFNRPGGGNGGPPQGSGGGAPPTGTVPSTNGSTQ